MDSTSDHRTSLGTLMRLLHTGDWHIGKRLYGVDRLDECRAALTKVARIAEAAEVDAILVAGDNLDRRIVEPAVLATCLRALEEMAVVAPVIAITGNHEDPLFWAEIAPYLAPRILLAADDAVLGISTGAGHLSVGCLPWPDPADAVLPAGAPRGEGRIVYADQVRERIDALAVSLRAERTTHGGVAVVLGHLMVVGARAGGGERELTLGGTYAIDGASFPDDVAYVALGHVHQPQAIPGYSGQGRYCGSPLALDFSGDGAEPSVLIVDISGGATQVTAVPVDAGRRLRRIRGTVDELVAQARELPDTWLFCEAVVDEAQLDTARAVRERIPSALRIEIVTPADARARNPEVTDLPGTLDLPDLYTEWVRTSGRVADARLIRAFGECVAQADGGD